MAKKKKTPLFSSKAKSVSITGKTTFGNAKITKGQGSLATSPAGMLPSKHTRRIIRTHHTLLKQQAIIQKDIEKEIAQIKRNNQTNGANITKHALEVPTLTSEKLTELQNSLESINKQIEENGGIEIYQKASISGQDNSRGGDTSKLLIEWLQELGITAHKKPKKEQGTTEDVKNPRKISLLEVGSLSAKNACSTSGIFDYIERIDLNSQDPKYIKQQDFMQRPLPKKSALVDENTEVFDLISLSLVVNYVSDPQTRGRMLLRSTEFLKKRIISRKNSKALQNKSHIKFNDTGDISTQYTEKGLVNDSKYDEVFPCLFFVLPAPCVTNSRYLTEDHLTEIMHSIGYTKLLKHKVTNKLAYWLWSFGEPLDGANENFRLSPYVQKELNIMKNQSFNGAPSNDTEKQGKKLFPKKEVNPGGGKNNFAITL
ncbi:uncharacterized protein SAPINGB_P003128 [Magnusiomyces paraingens]|uniref:25S rRNA adenine-N(1) methyltransferase n=1 Tax=Magnusiomyces paraingens TaxID=2606893 RepID=A0A5E8BIP8_9ASCO|nr:uncharacterized protein SAPINGB_P003128 [Saprochaete ingens]VVT51534.1 unnamed protein product [Saprochaete ingens]